MYNTSKIVWTSDKLQQADTIDIKNNYAENAIERNTKMEVA